MPIYQYNCPGCDVTIELIQPMNQKVPDVDCAECGGCMERIISSKFAIHLKGDGWYKPGTS